MSHDIEMGENMQHSSQDVSDTNLHLHHHRLTLTFHNVNFSVITDGGKSRDILKNVSGRAESGELLAIMGATGAGKTSFLNILSQRVQSTKLKTVSGEFALNGETFTAQNFKKHAAYIMQEDILMETLTAREIFTFAAALRLPKSMTEKQKQAAVEHTITSLRLEKCADTRVGGVFIRGVSGGEKKRVSIGMELITNPSVLFVDEPTSGLDSFTAEKVTILLKELASQGRTVITTIHQPSSDIFNLFDKLLLLSAGSIIYFGPANEAIDYFAALGYACPQYSNPADYFMKIMQPGTPEDNARLEVLVSAYAQKQTELTSKGNEHQNFGEKSSVITRADEPTYMTKLGKLSNRAFTNFIRQPMMTKMRLIQNVFLGFLTGFLFWSVTNTQNGVQDRNGALFFVTINNTMTAIMTTVLSFPPEKAIFVRETANNTYSTGLYYWGKTIAEFPFQFIFPIVNASIAYWLIGLQPHFQKFLVLLTVAILLSLAGQSYGLLIGCLVADANVAVAITPMTVIPLMLFAGFFSNSDSLPWPFKILQWISPFFYGFNALALNEFGGLTLSCTDDEYLVATSGDNDSSNMQRICPITDGQQVIDGLSIRYQSILFQILALVVITVIIRVLGFIVLKLKTKSIY